MSDFRVLLLLHGSQAGIAVHGDTPWGTLQVAHGVIRFHSDDVLCPPKTPQNTIAIALEFWQKVKRQKIFNWHLEMNLPVRWNIKLWFILELSSSRLFQRGSKFQILVGVLITNHQSFTPVPCIRGRKANMPRGTLQVADGVIRFCSDDVFCPQKTPKNTKAIVLAESEMTKNFQLALENESPSPEEHKTVVHSGIELLMIIS